MKKVLEVKNCYKLTYLRIEISEFNEKYYYFNIHTKKKRS